MNRFSQKDIVRGSVISGTSLNRYLYCENDPLNFIDPSGESLKSMVNTVKAKATTALNKATNFIANAATAITSKAAQVIKPVKTTTQYTNPVNTVQTTNQAKQDARRAMDFANTVAPGSAQAQQAARAYAQTVQYSQIANATNNPTIAHQAVNASRTAVNFANSAMYAPSTPAYTSTNNNDVVLNTSSPSIVSTVNRSNESCNKKASFGIQLKTIFSNIFGSADYISSTNEILSPPIAPTILFYAVEGYKHQNDILVNGNDDKPIVVFDRSYGKDYEYGIAFSGDNGGVEISVNIKDGITFYSYYVDENKKDYFSTTISLNNMSFEKGNTIYTDGIEESFFIRTYLSDPHNSLNYVNMIEPVAPFPIPIVKAT